MINLIKIGILHHKEQNETTASFQYNLKTCNFKKATVSFKNICFSLQCKGLEMKISV